MGKTRKDPNTGTCKVYSSVLIKVIYYEMGYSVAKQRYIMSVEKYAVEEDWKFPQSPLVNQNKEVDFNHFVTV